MRHRAIGSGLHGAFKHTPFPPPLLPQYVHRLLRMLRVEDVLPGGWCWGGGSGDSLPLIQVVAIVCVHAALIDSSESKEAASIADTLVQLKCDMSSAVNVFSAAGRHREAFALASLVPSLPAPSLAIAEGGMSKVDVISESTSDRISAAVVPIQKLLAAMHNNPAVYA